MVVAVGSQDIVAQKKFKDESAAGVMFLNDSEFMLERALELPAFAASNGHKILLSSNAYHKRRQDKTRIYSG